MSLTPCPLCADASEIGGVRCPVCTPIPMARCFGIADPSPNPEGHPMPPPITYTFTAPRAATLAERGAMRHAARHLDATPLEGLPPGLEFAAELLADRDVLPGPEFFWDESRGPKGRWALAESICIVGRDAFEALAREVVRHKPIDGARLVPLATSLLEEYRQHCAPERLKPWCTQIQAVAKADDARPAPLAAEAKDSIDPIKLTIYRARLRDAKAREDKARRRANELSDIAGDLSARLRSKRAECDELRDEVERLRAKLGEGAR